MTGGGGDSEMACTSSTEYLLISRYKGGKKHSKYINIWKEIAVVVVAVVMVVPMVTVITLFLHTSLGT